MASSPLVVPAAGFRQGLAFGDELPSRPPGFPRAQAAQKPHEAPRSQLTSALQTRSRCFDPTGAKLPSFALIAVRGEEERLIITLLGDEPRKPSSLLVSAVTTP